MIVPGFAAVAVVVAQAWPTNGDKESPEGLIAIGSAAPDDPQKGGNREIVSVAALRGRP